MGATQAAFLREFADVFRSEAPDVSWTGGQGKHNTASLLTHQAGRRGGAYNKAERFELGDLTAAFNDHKIIIEFESKQVAIANLLKYWPYLRGELSSKPELPVLICHFSDWWSYGVYRDLWQWTLSQMQSDPKCLQHIVGCQFDHGGSNVSLRHSAIEQAVEWLLRRATVTE
ncbi:hypothetical protein [Alkalilimnicola sp. S0819]|uniref:hypothetical protein n=1 Tax=Alkalilimnicola sp. S0819 TaxID=2613922 RepID=UPI00126239B2|nr:hypothetical protein [Alkalilimnicola sp. S0819]KAB7619489.1 hypothetical protein F3N43_13680 [Alkalilimnicola sp. S0819]MPQ17687.1 hypothetical protein [Alkalilimnicola sp. S0819]